MDGSNGKIKRKLLVDNMAVSPVRFSKDGKTAYVIGWNKNMYAFDTKTGKRLWKNKFGKSGNVTDTFVGEDGTIFVGEGTYIPSRITAIDPKTGKVKWRYGRITGTAKISFPPVFDKEGNIYFATSTGMASCVKQDGNFAWNVRVVKSIYGGSYSQPVLIDHILYISDAYKGLLAINKKDGSIIEDLSTFTERDKKNPYASGFSHMEADPSKEIIFVGNPKGDVYALKSHLYKEKPIEVKLEKQESSPKILKEDNFIKIGNVKLNIRKHIP